MSKQIIKIRSLIFHISYISMGFYSVVCYSGCPEPKLLDPCTCNDSIIVCGGEQHIDLEKIFDKLNNSLKNKRKYFDEIIINNTAVTQLTDNMFKDFKFHTIFIYKAISLKRIHINAFKGSLLDAKVFVLQKCENFDSLELFDILNNFVNIETISIGFVNITKIPANVFKAHHKLYSLAIYGESFREIGENAFHSLNAIKFIDIINTSISHIPQNVFVFESSDILVHIGLYYNQLDGNSLSVGSLANIGRPAEFHFMGVLEEENSDKIKFLNQMVFEPFFKANDKNIVVLKYDVLDCKDCKNKWLKTNPEYGNRVLPLRCSSHKPFDNSDNFVKC